MYTCPASCSPPLASHTTQKIRSLHFLRALPANRIDGLKTICTRKRNKGEGTETCILLLWQASDCLADCCWAGLQPLQGTWSLGLSFKGFLSCAMIPKGGGKRNPLSHEEGRKGESCEGNKPKPNTQAAVWQAPILLAILSPEQLKTGH